MPLDPSGTRHRRTPRAITGLGIWMLASLALFASRAARAEGAVRAEGARGPDTSYGRIDGDLSLALGLGATLGPTSPRATADVRFRYLDTVGAFATYEDGPLVGSDPEPRRVVALGVEVRPLFIARWLQGLEFGTPHLDLAVDSFGLELGAFFAEPHGDTFGSRRGLQAGLGVELPILARAKGLWIGLHGGVRWSDAALAGSPVLGPADRAMYLAMTVSWHVFFGAHVVDLFDRRPER